MHSFFFRLVVYPQPPCYVVKPIFTLYCILSRSITRKKKRWFHFYLDLNAYTDNASTLAEISWFSHRKCVVQQGMMCQNAVEWTFFCDCQSPLLRENSSNRQWQLLNNIVHIMWWTKQSGCFFMWLMNELREWASFPLIRTLTILWQAYFNFHIALLYRGFAYGGMH